MKSLLIKLSGQVPNALCLTICLLPFAQKRILNLLDSSMVLVGSLLLLIFASVFLLSVLVNIKCRKYFISILKSRWLLGMILSWLLLISLSTIATNTDQITALLVIGITLISLLLGWLTFVVSHDENMILIIRALGISAFLIISIALPESLNIEPLNTWIKFINGNSTYVNIDRISAIFIHPNYMAMYLELTLPFVLVWMLLAHHKLLKIFLGLILVLGLNMLVLSLSRGGIIAFFSSVFILGLFAFYKRQRVLPLVSIAILSIVTLTITVQVLLLPRLVVRYLSEGSNDIWYRAAYNATESVLAAPGETLFLDVEVTNEGLFEWEIEGTEPVNLAYHIICWDDDLQRSLDGVKLSSLNYLVAQGPRTGLPRNVKPNETVTLNTALIAPDAPGEYMIAWDMVQESVTWFSNKGLTPGVTMLTVSGPGVVNTADCGTQIYDQETQTDHLSRLEIWGTAIQVIGDNPMLGIGVRNYSSYYEMYNDVPLDIPHTHNSYLNFLVDFGAPSGIFLGFTMLLVIHALVKSQPSNHDKQGWYIWFGICLALLSFSLHSLVESFNYQPAIILVVCVIVGLLARFTLGTAPDTD